MAELAPNDPMREGFSEEQRLLETSLRRYLAERYGFERRRKAVASGESLDRQVWRDFLSLRKINIADGTAENMRRQIVKEMLGGDVPL
jgi:hypothetical protein